MVKIENVLRCTLGLLILLALRSACAERVETVLKGGWTCDGEAVEIPHTWNAFDAADGLGVPEGYDPKLLDSSGSPSYLRKRAVYARSLPNSRAGRRYFLRCLGASIKAEVRVNGIEIGRHAGPFTAFAFEITTALNSTDNRVEIAVDNRFDPDVQAIHADFSTYGGLYRDVVLIETDPVCIDPVTDGARGVRIEADPETGRVRAFVSVLGGTNEVQEFFFPSPVRWSPENPKLYELDVHIAQNGSTDSIRESFGFRTVEFRADGFYLNGVRRKIRGVNRHQDRAGKGWAVSALDEEEDIRWIKRMGADGLRTCHYPQSWHIYDLCDREGLLVWTELPNVDGLTFTEAFRSNNYVTAREMVAQNRNHPCIFAWGVFNELYNMKMPKGSAEPEMVLLRGFLKELDSSRVTVAATWNDKLMELNAIPDQIGFNLYPGWYAERPEQMKERIARALERNGRKICAVSEYGAGASITQHADALVHNLPAGPFHSEEYQAYVHSANYRAIAADDRVWGSFVWAMFDLGSDLRRESDNLGINTKGIVTFDRNTPKDAFWFYKANWNPEPLLHLVGMRMASTTNATATVLTFANVGAVTLSVCGRDVGTQEPNEVKTVLWRDVPLRMGPNRVVVRSGDLVREAVWTRK